MGFLHLYARVLAKLGPDSGSGWLLALANVAVAVALFAEPVLFGRVINVLAGAQADAASTDWTSLWLLLLAWAGFGLFTIICGTLIALFADRLAHRRRLAVLTSYFEHVLQLPLAYHGETHSGRLMKTMLQGTDALWAFWLGFFREHLAAFVSLFLLVPLALFLNWRMAILLVVLCIVFAALTALMLRKTETLQSIVQTHHSDLAERASDALGNIALVHSYVRVESEVIALKSVSERLLAAQYPVLSWWAVATVLTRASTTLAILSIIALGTWLFRKGLITVGEIATFMALAGIVIARLEQAVSFANRMTLDAARLREFFDVLDTIPAMHDRPGAVDPGRFTGRVEFDNVSFAYDGTRPAVSGLSFTALPGETVALVGATGAGKSTALMLLHRAFDRNPDASGSTASTCAISSSVRSDTISGWCSRKRFCSTARLLKTCVPGSPTQPTSRCVMPPPARKRSISSNTMSRALTRKLANAGVRYRVASASGCPLHGRCSRIRRS
jgi:ATP-binding cassette, subfamily B, beta-glucan exporter